MENLITLFIALTAVAIFLQAGLLAGMYMTMRKTSAKVETLAEEVKGKALPALDSAQSVLTEIRPKLQTITENLVEVTTTVKSQVLRVDDTVKEVVDRARLQVIRTDEMITRTLDRVEATSDVVQRTVTSPVRQVSGVIRGISAGIEYFLGHRGPQNGGSRDARRPVPQDEMFI